MTSTPHTPSSEGEYTPTLDEVRDFVIRAGRAQHPHISDEETGSAFDRRIEAIRKDAREAVVEAHRAMTQTVHRFPSHEEFLNHLNLTQSGATDE